MSGKFIDFEGASPLAANDLDKAAVKRAMRVGVEALERVQGNVGAFYQTMLGACLIQIRVQLNGSQFRGLVMEAVRRVEADFTTLDAAEASGDEDAEVELLGEPEELLDATQEFLGHLDEDNAFAMCHLLLACMTGFLTNQRLTNEVWEQLLQFIESQVPKDMLK